MSKKSIALLALLIISPVIIYFIWPTEESRIRRLVRQGATAIEKEDIDGVMSKISYNYRDEYGLSYLIIKKQLERKFKAYSDIEFDYENLTVEVFKETGEATAAMDLRMIAMSGEQMGYVIGGEGPALLKLRLKKSGPLKKWQVVEASGFIERH